jgi:hypothetical protein
MPETIVFFQKHLNNKKCTYVLYKLIKPSCLEPVAQLEPKFDGIVIGWSFSKIVSDSSALPPRWPPQCSCVVIPDTILEEDHPMTILSKFGSN